MKGFSSRTFRQWCVRILDDYGVLLFWLGFLGLWIAALSGVFMMVKKGMQP